MLLIIITSLSVCFFPGNVPYFAANAGEMKGIPPSLAADYIHAVIEADRKIYSEIIVDRLGRAISLEATENWREEDTLLLPAQFLMESSNISNLRGVGMKYRLLSLWPINKKNSAKTETEKTALQEVIKNPDKPFTWVVQTGGTWYFQAIYPDKAITHSCVSCHNSHPKSPKKDFKEGDVMGGIFINLPLGRREYKIGEGKYLLPPEVVSDYIHSILDSDRYIYSKYIVDRLQSKNILHASEAWENENALPLPAQFLLIASRLIKQKNLGLDFRLISLWPINPQNGPANEFERVGLESVSIHPIRPYIGQTQLGNKRYFQAIYPDFAVAPSCVACHNAHPNSPKRDFKFNDVIGGIAVTLDLSDRKGQR